LVEDEEEKEGLAKGYTNKDIELTEMDKGKPILLENAEKSIEKDVSQHEIEKHEKLSVSEI